MGANQIDLQLENLIAGDANVAKLSDTGGDGVRKFIAGHNFIDYGASPVHTLARIRRQKYRPAFDGNFANCFER
jgi:hypothetical protein